MQEAGQEKASSQEPAVNGASDYQVPACALHFPIFLHKQAIEASHLSHKYDSQ